MNFLELFNKVLLELNYRPLTRDMVATSADANDFGRIFKTEHLRVLENLRRTNGEVCSSAAWDYIKCIDCVFRVFPPLGGSTSVACEKTAADVCPKADEQEPAAMPKIYTAYGADNAPKVNLEGPDDVSAIPAAYLDVLIYGAALKTKANPAHPKFGFWSSSYTRALARMRAECKLDANDKPYISVKGARKLN